MLDSLVYDSTLFDYLGRISLTCYIKQYQVAILKHMAFEILPDHCNLPGPNVISRLSIPAVKLLF